MRISLRAQRVYAGIAVMDEKHGLDWVFRVDPDTLDMGEPCRCVVGQFYGDTAWWDLDTDPTVDQYEAGVRAMGLVDRLFQTDHGFFTAEDFDPRSRDYNGAAIDADYAVLTRMWAYAIRRLRVLRGGES